MAAIGRRAFLGVAGLGAAAVTIGSSHSAESANYAESATEYGRLSRSIVFGVGKGESASLSFVWLPAQGREQLPPLKARLVIFDLGGKMLADKEVAVAPFTGASVDFNPPKGTNRQQLFGYVYVEGFDQVVDEIFAGLEVFDTSSGRANIFAAPIGVA